MKITPPHVDVPPADNRSGELFSVALSEKSERSLSCLLDVHYFSVEASVSSRQAQGQLSRGAERKHFGAGQIGDSAAGNF